MKHLKNILTLLYGFFVALTVSVFICYAFRGKFPAFFTSWAFIWLARLIGKAGAFGVLIITIVCCSDWLRKRGDMRKTFLLGRVIRYYSEFSKLDDRQISYVQFIITFLFVGFFLFLEFALREANIYASKPELSNEPYVSSYDASHEKGWLHISMPNIKYHSVNSEFVQDYAVNSHGFVDREWRLEKKKPVRIGCIGDSFTQGVGAVADSSYPALLGKLLSEQAEVMNFGMSGSDPVFGRMILKTIVLPYNPDVVTLTVNGTDIPDIVVRGGTERFASDGTTHFHQPPWWEGLYSHCYLVRLVAVGMCDIDWTTYLTQKKLLSEKEKAMAIIESTLDSAHAICAERNIRLIIIFHPDENEVKADKMQCEPVMRYCQKRGYETLDVLASFKSFGMTAKNAHDYFWAQDAHNNRFGYELFAKSLEEKIALKN